MLHKIQTVQALREVAATFDLISSVTWDIRLSFVCILQSQVHICQNKVSLVQKLLKRISRHSFIIVSCLIK